MARPLFDKSIDELEEIVAFAKQVGDLDLVAQELIHRKTKRAQALNDKIKDKKIVHTPDSILTSLSKFNITTETLPEKKFKDPIVARLVSWIALEALSPQSFRNPEDLAAGDRNCVAKLKISLPWEKGERSRKNYKLYYEVILGSIKVDVATEKLVALFGDDEEKQRPGQTRSAIASVLIDKDGFLIAENAVAISSFAWALPHCLEGRFSTLSQWSKVEQEVMLQLDELLRRQDDEGNPLPLTISTIQHVYNTIVASFGIPEELVVPPEFTLRKYQYFKNKEEPSCSLLNSFFIEDLCTAIEKYENNNIGEALNRYLGVTQQKKKFDLLKSPSVLEQAVAPKQFPDSRWPVGPNRSLVLLQQAAVNIAKNELDVSGMISVNGPPGTGKTTLLRDVVAHAVTTRANTMCDFADPLDAFDTSGIKIPTGGKGFWHLYSLDERIKGHEILVASSNNSAVENISHELPGYDSMANDDVRYFQTVSEAMARAVLGSEEETKEPIEPKSWGLAAAALGNASNRKKFTDVFWWDKDASMRLYLKAAKGDDVLQEIRDENTGEIIERRMPAVAVNENPPASKAEAKKRWSAARNKFKTLQREIQGDISKVEQVRVQSLDLIEALRELKKHRENIEQSAEMLANLLPASHAFTEFWHQAKSDFKGQISRLISDRSIRPHWLARLFNPKKGHAWRQLITAFEGWLTQDRKISTLQRSFEEQRKELCGDGPIDLAFFQKDHIDKQITPPWFSEELQAKREMLFVAALNVHKAFIDVSAQKILHNLSILMGTFSSGGMSDPEKRRYLGDLWSTLFLTVPVVSTAFASVHRMLGDLPPESLGWLLIDEAGQAIPQAAVGALLRAKRTVVVGDPIQIEPVVTLPEKLVVEICKHFNVEVDGWAPPKASAQTLADRASKYQSAFESDTGDRLVGVPLLVHRRCEEPMFSISNEAAYNNQMVSQVKQTDGGAIRQSLGPSRWFSVDGEASSKWCPKEGDAVIKILHKLASDGVTEPDTFIITPFRIVAQEMRRRINQEDILFESLGLDPRQFAKFNVGTVHTVQGREANTVILLLGAPNASQGGARNWAGSPENLLNVAVSRAKKNLYVVGSRGAWSGAGSFAVLSKKLVDT